MTKQKIIRLESLGELNSIVFEIKPNQLVILDKDKIGDGHKSISHRWIGFTLESVKENTSVKKFKPQKEFNPLYSVHHKEDIKTNATLYSYEIMESEIIPHSDYQLNPTGLLGIFKSGLESLKLLIKSLTRCL